MSRAECCALMEGSDACFAPVLSMAEAPQHPHNIARGNFIEVDGVTQPGPAPQFSHTPAGPVSPPPQPGEHTDSLLARHELEATEIAGCGPRASSPRNRGSWAVASTSTMVSGRMSSAMMRVEAGSGWVK